MISMDSLVPADFAERIAAVAGASAPVEVAVMEGGHSGVTHLAVVDGRDVVIKSAPVGRRAVGRHDVLRQARAIEAVRGYVPVPRVLFSDTGPPPFFGMERAAGVAVDPVIAPGLERDAATVAAAWEAAIDLLARLHAAPVGFTDEPARAPADELAVWAATIRAAGMEDDPAAAGLRDALAAGAPRAGAPALVHGDFRLGNLLMEGAVPRALIDWEIWSLGEPLVDLGWFVQFTDPENFPGVGRDVPGTPTADAVVEAYLARAGRSPDGVPWYLALGCFKLAAIQAHNRRRHLEGRYHDPYQELLGPSIERLLERGAELLAS
jgi:aminoglycoside phosphotransferase (APT) family kinase protein